MQHEKISIESFFINLDPKFFFSSKIKTVFPEIELETELFILFFIAVKQYQIIRKKLKLVEIEKSPFELAMRSLGNVRSKSRLFDSKEEKKKENGKSTSINYLAL